MQTTRNETNKLWCRVNAVPGSFNYVNRGLSTAGSIPIDMGAVSFMERRANSTMRSTAETQRLQNYFSGKRKSSNTAGQTHRLRKNIYDTSMIDVQQQSDRQAAPRTQQDLSLKQGFRKMGLKQAPQTFRAKKVSNFRDSGSKGVFNPMIGYARDLHTQAQLPLNSADKQI